MARSTVTIGRMVLREDDVVAEQVDNTGNRALALSGQESIPRLTAVGVERQREDILGLAGHFLPVLFTTKSYLNGYYTVDSVSGNIEDWDYGMKIFPWTMNLLRVGKESEVDIESRLSGALTRQNNFAVTGERVHAPAIGHKAYWSDATASSAVLRTTTDGVISAYRGIGATVSPRWMATPADYAKGRVRIFDEEGIERAARVGISTSAWELNNGLVRVKPLSAGGALEISAWSGTTWKAKAWDTRAGLSSLAPFDSCTILYNEFEAVCIRLMKSLTVGRVYVDLTLRRGFRFVEIYIQSEIGADLKIVRGTAEAGSSSIGGTVVASANDADGNKYIVGSARTFTADIVNGGITKTASATLDAFVGVVFGGTSAVAGDAALDLQKQYIGAPSEFVQGVQR